MNSIVLLSDVEPKGVEEAHWIEAMQEELYQLMVNEIWELLPRPKDHPVIGTK